MTAVSRITIWTNAGGTDPRAVPHRIELDDTDVTDLVLLDVPFCWQIVPEPGTGKGTVTLLLHPGTAVADGDGAAHLDLPDGGRLALATPPGSVNELPGLDAWGTQLAAQQLYFYVDEVRFGTPDES